VRDLLDPEGAEERFLARYERRSFRLWVDADGLAHGKFVFDDESAEWVRTIIDSTLRPRRGGPRFVTAAEQARAKSLQDDPRTNHQLAHDLLIDVLRTGSVAAAETVFGVRQAGIKLVQVVNHERHLAHSASASATPNHAGGTNGTNGDAKVTRFQEGGTVVPPGIAAQLRCNSGSQPVFVDAHGDPMNVGRAQRLFTPKQRVALAVRDGGCRWAGCDRPASYCEAHHIDRWSDEQGRTDIARGVLLCRFHHMQLHNGGWRITRAGLGPFLLHAPPQTSGSPPQSAGPPPRASDSPTQSTGIPSQTSSSSPHTSVSPPDSQPPPVELRAPLPLHYSWQLASHPPGRWRNAA